MTHKVKGIGMSNFTDKEVELLQTQGNKVCYYQSNIKLFLNLCKIIYNESL